MQDLTTETARDFWSPTPWEGSWRAACRWRQGLWPVLRQWSLEQRPCLGCGPHVGALGACGGTVKFWVFFRLVCLCRPPPPRTRVVEPALPSDRPFPREPTQPRVGLGEFLNRHVCSSVAVAPEGLR